MDSKKLSSGSFAAVGFQGPILIGTARRQRALSVKTALAPATAKTSPPKAGPTIVEMFSCSPVKVDAEGSCSSDTISGTRAEKAGAFSANPVPIRNTEPRMTAGFRGWGQQSTGAPP